jgi:hypothetical protein
MESKPVVLGLEMASAEAAERARLAAGGQDPSPLAGMAYSHEHGEFDLTTLVPSRLDSQIAELVEKWKQSGEVQRERLRRALTLDDNYTIIQFAKRQAVRSLSEPGTELCEQGLIALAMLDESRIDPRDASCAAGLLNHTASRLRSPGVFDRATGFATPGMAALMCSAMGSTLQDWGYREWPSRSGVGFIRSSGARYEPTIDLVAVAQRIANEVLSERYVIGDVEVATEVPAVWFAKERRESAARILGRSPGIVGNHGSLRTSVAPPIGQMLVIWVAELPSSAEGAQLVADVGDGDTLDGRFVVGTTAGRLFVLLVAGSCQQGVEPFESAATVKDLASHIQQCLGQSSDAA